LQIQYPKGNGLNPDPRMAEVPNRLDAMTKVHIGIATVEVHTAASATNSTAAAVKHGSTLYNRNRDHELVKRHPDRLSHRHRAAARSTARAKVLEHAIRDLKCPASRSRPNVVGKYFDSKDIDPSGRRPGTGRAHDYAPGVGRRR
jgi:hypothetical protein